MADRDLQYELERQTQLRRQAESKCDTIRRWWMEEQKARADAERVLELYQDRCDELELKLDRAADTLSGL